MLDTESPIVQEEITARNTATYVHLGGSALNPTLLPPNEAHEAAYETSIDQNRDAILGLPRNESGLNLDRIHAYRQKIGAPKKELLFLNSDEFEKALLVSGDDHGDNHPHGVYLTQLDVIIVKRDPDLEDLNGTEITESLAVHEVAHSSAVLHPIRFTQETKGRFRKKTTVISERSRSGFAVSTMASEKDRGSLLEEGYAEYERGQFMLEQGRKGGFVTPGEDFDRVSAMKILPGQYYALKPSSEGAVEPQLVFAEADFAAATIDLLVAQDPQLTDALRESRKSVEGLRDVVRRINAIMPGLYQRMHDVDLHAPDVLKQSAAIMVDVYKATVSTKLPS